MAKGPSSRVLRTLFGPVQRIFQKPYLGTLCYLVFDIIIPGLPREPAQGFVVGCNLGLVFRVIRSWREGFVVFPPIHTPVIRQFILDPGSLDQIPSINLPTSSK